MGATIGALESLLISLQTLHSSSFTHQCLLAFPQFGLSCRLQGSPTTSRQTAESSGICSSFSTASSAGVSAMLLQTAAVELQRESMKLMVASVTPVEAASREGEQAGLLLEFTAKT